ncbi:SusC/RagA family TonB-linked outer membrane protein [Chitinophaga arvensicola]|uniref:TonB-linked outer membrane protein, SusC/RagA family n=1 Tax=Chitinophaga arvensicola TaxID=29529 RepID=A0A1I0SBV0_9BACT|nr:TonB-dependent receptor [Chitinophaga arvensicola]SEW54307.1 TonB-linked outer membrane protein, SusC/RagA family [Chitinophaga arvensicola]
MKMTAFLLLTACLHISAKGLSQQITLSEKNAPLKKVLKEVARQAGISVVYDEALLSSFAPVNVDVSNVSVKEALDICLKNQPLAYVMEGKRITLVNVLPERGAADSTITVTGVVLNEAGEPIPGATIRVQNSTAGTAADAEGRFTLKVPNSRTLLLVSFIGYDSKSVAPASGLLRIQLKPANTALTETVVVGYGIQKKSVVTGAISSVRAADIESQPITRIEQVLQGRTSGLTVASSSGQPGSNSSVRVRGITSFNNNNPLWVIDGVVVDNGGIGYLNQYDIESVEVLKDAASQAIYGARAAAGVILVTTKKGKAGKITVSYNGYLGTSAPAKKLNLLDATQYANMINEANTNDGKAAVYTDPNSFGKGTDWQGTIFNNNAFRQNHEISISGGGDKSTFYTSFGYLKQEGIVASDISKYDRANFRLNSTHKITPWLTWGENVGYAYDKAIGIGNTNNEYGGPLSSAINLDPITPAVETDPAKAAGAPYAGNPVRRDAQGRPYGISKVVGQEITNPLAYISTRLGNYNWSHNIVGNTYLEMEPLKGLKIRSTVGAKIAFWGDETFTPKFYLNATNAPLTTTFNRGQHTQYNYNLENIISYTRDFHKHHVTLLAGQGAYMENRMRETNVTFFDIPAETFEQASLNFKVAAANRISNGAEGIEHKVSSLFARVNYNFDEKYMVEGIIRRDGSSRFGPENRYGVFPSASVGWVASKEAFWPQNKVVEFLKFRGGYGTVGSDEIGDLAFLSTIGSGRNYTFGSESTAALVGYSPNAPSNPALKWESSSQTNIGFEATLLQNITLSFDWYKKETKNILQKPRIPFYIGAIDNPAANVGSMNNSGVELELGYRTKIGQVDFSANGNVSYLKNEVTFLGNGVSTITEHTERFQGMPEIVRTEVGHPFNSFYGYQSQGIFQNQAEVDAWTNKAGGKLQPNAKPGDFRWADLNGDGSINDLDRTFLGNPTPSWTYGLTLNAAYKGFDIVVFGQGASGNKIFQGLRRLDLGNANWQTRILDRWHGEGTSNDNPRLTVEDKNRNYSNLSNYYLEDGGYFRIKNLQFGYSLPQSVTKRIGLQKIRVYVMSENLVTITKYTGYDPEIGGTNALSIDRGIYPQARSFMGGLNVTF